MKISNFDLEKKIINSGTDFVIGIDEAGRGPLAGPVVASAVLLKNKNLLDEKYEIKELDLIRDSKTLSAKQREKIFDFIHEHFHVGVGICNHETIDRINILEASFLAMKEAINSLAREITNYKLPARNASHSDSGGQIPNKKQKLKLEIQNSIILVDGNKAIPNCSYRQEAVIGGDGIVKSISAASIVAKVSRDKIMLEAHEKYPEYGFDKHKGYGTKLHMEKIRECGPCKIHRKSFEPMKSLAKSEF